MFKNFTDEYKKVLLDAENAAKAAGDRTLEERDVFLEVMKLSAGPAYELVTSYGLNEKIVLDVLSHPKFAVPGDRKVAYAGPSDALKNTIVSSIKVAASFEKRKAGVEDFILAMLKARSAWFVEMLDFLGIIPKDFEQALVTVNTNLRQDGTPGAPMDPINKILSALESNFLSSMKDSKEDQDDAVPSPAQPGKKGAKPASDTPALDFFCHDLTQEARDKKIDKIVGRDVEIERLISILNRKSKNNPCLVGDPGVGKTAVVEGLALRVAQGTVPYAMQNKRVLALDMTSMVAGTKYRGEFEVRMKQVIEEASKLENEVVLFIDEIHTIIGAGGAEGTLDAANILKPAMGRGKIRVIGATTLNEYQKHIEKDSALERRFQKIEVGEPSRDVAVEVLKGLREGLEEYHNLVIGDDALAEAVDLSIRYVTNRFLPDKAIDLVDEACSSKSMKYEPVDGEAGELRQEIAQLQKNIQDFIQSGQFEKARQAKDKLLPLEEKARKSKPKIPREKRSVIGAADIQKVVHQITGVPMKNLSDEEHQKLLELGATLKAQVIGQDEAADAVVAAIRRSRVGIANQNRPTGSFLFLGPTGVGKTELVKVLAREFYGDEKALIKIDMSEFSERHTGSKLIGTAPGYVGYEEGGRLTEQVRRKPYSVILFDELEKGDPEVFNILLQILEDGEVTDGKGRKVNFRNAVIIMTSNLGSEEFNSSARKIGFDATPSQERDALSDFEQARAGVMKRLEKQFKPEFINRIDKVVVFRPLDKTTIARIVELRLAELKVRLATVGVKLAWKPKATEAIVAATYDPEYGARPVRRFVQDKIEDEVAGRMLEKDGLKSVTLGAKNGTLTFETA